MIKQTPLSFKALKHNILVLDQIERHAKNVREKRCKRSSIWDLLSR
jgi:hypothetical protein